MWNDHTWGDRQIFHPFPPRSSKHFEIQGLSKENKCSLHRHSADLKPLSLLCQHTYCWKVPIAISAQIRKKLTRPDKQVHLLGWKKKHLHHTHSVGLTFAKRFLRLASVGGGHRSNRTARCCNRSIQLFSWTPPYSFYSETNLHLLQYLDLRKRHTLSFPTVKSGNDLVQNMRLILVGLPKAVCLLSVLHMIGYTIWYLWVKYLSVILVTGSASLLGYVSGCTRLRIRCLQTFLFQEEVIILVTETWGLKRPVAMLCIIIIIYIIHCSWVNRMGVSLQEWIWMTVDIPSHFYRSEKEKCP